MFSGIKEKRPRTTGAVFAFSPFRPLGLNETRSTRSVSFPDSKHGTSIQENLICLPISEVLLCVCVSCLCNSQLHIVVCIDEHIILQVVSSSYVCQGLSALSEPSSWGFLFQHQ